MTIVVLAVAGLIALALLLDNAPKIIREVADARALRDREGLYTREELVAGLLVAIERTDADVGGELAERLALTVLEDLDDGVIGPELKTPPS